ncbi:ribulose-phosphate 3-epimerase [Orbaceae bacterium ac157xtp]
MQIYPSLYNADIYHIKSILNRLNECQINGLHIDVMDGKFVTAQAFGPELISSLKQNTHFYLDCHLMIKEPEYTVENYIQAGADSITFHIESTSHAMYLAQIIKQNKIKAGIAINPATPIEVLSELLPFIDLVLVMTVNPGRSGQTFITNMLHKVEKLSALKQKHGLQYLIQVDGNVNDNNILACKKAGADIAVSGGYIFKHNLIEDSIQQLKQAMLGD